jgi:SAM-dependent methyltransferase
LSISTDTATRYDQISGVYDETREPLSTDALDKVAAILQKSGDRRLLEAGVGTGRIAFPLQRRGFEVVGIDLSRGMLAKARAKGLAALIQADANSLPFKDRCFDAVLMAHVLHLLDDPAKTIESLGRVATNDIIALVTKRERGFASSDVMASPIREAFRKAAAELGYLLPERPAGWSGFQREEEFLVSNPPHSLLTVEDKEVVTTLGERLSIFEKRAYGHLNDIPEDRFKEILRRATVSLDLNHEVRYRRIEQVAVWKIRSS